MKQNDESLEKIIFDLSTGGREAWQFTFGTPYGGISLILPQAAYGVGNEDAEYSIAHLVKLSKLAEKWNQNMARFNLSKFESKNENLEFISDGKRVYETRKNLIEPTLIKKICSADPKANLAIRQLQTDGFSLETALKKVGSYNLSFSYKGEPDANKQILLCIKEYMGFI